MIAEVTYTQPQDPGHPRGLRPQPVFRSTTRVIKTAPGTFFLPPSYFGYTTFPAANFFIATLEGLQARLQRHRADACGSATRTSGRASRPTPTTTRRATRTPTRTRTSRATCSGSTANAPFQYGRQPGSIVHLFKMGGSYDLPTWASSSAAAIAGTRARSRARRSRRRGRNLPYRVATAYEFNGVSQRWLAEDAVGSLTNPSWGQFDLRFQYVTRVQKAKIEAFVDIFNVFNNQDATRLQDLLAGSGGMAYQDADPVPGSAALLHRLPGRLLSLAHSRRPRGDGPCPSPFSCSSSIGLFRRFNILPAPVRRLMKV